MNGEPLEQRKLDEIEFHDQRERDRLAAANIEEFYHKYPNKSFYAINRGVKEDIRSWMKNNCEGAVALDYCCGLGNSTLDLAEFGATVHAVDISQEELSTAERSAKAAGYADRTTFYAMDAEDMSFPNEFFDVAICNGVLHHLDLTKAYPQLARVLKPTGQIICIEAQGANPLINLYRRRTPHLRTAWEAKHILSLQQVRQAKPYFGKVDIQFYHLFTILAIPFRKTRLFRPLLTIFERIDKIVLKIPVIQKLAWQMIFVLSEPRSSGAEKSSQAG